MKSVENESIWNMLLGEIEKAAEKSDIQKEEDCVAKEKLTSLALYTYERDIETRKVSEYELAREEREGRLFSSNIFVRMIRHYRIRSRLENSDFSRHIRLLTNIHAHLGNAYYFKAEEKTARELFAYGNMLSDFDIGAHEPLLDRITEAAIFLRRYGIDIKAERGSLSLSEEMNQKIFDIIDGKISSVSGNCVLERMFREHFNEYIEIFDLYNISRRTDGKRNEPINLLLNLAVKSLRANVTHSAYISAESRLDEIFNLARAWLDVLDVQGESGIEYSLMRHESFPVYFSNEILFDKICIPRQYSQRFILLLLDSLIKPWFDRAKKDYTFKDYYRIAEYITSIKAPCLYLTADGIKRATGVARYKAEMILNDISQPIKNVNSDFTSLEGGINFNTRPVIKFPFDKYLYIDFHFTGFGFYLAAYDMIKASLPELDRILGASAEKMLRSEIAKKGYSFEYGDYTSSSDSSDCDLVIKTADKVFFFEVKKKDIANEFNRLDDVAALEELSKGMIAAQMQGFRHKRNLLKDKQLCLKSEEGDGKVAVSGNELIYVFSVCLPEYSFLTSKVFSSKLIEILLLGGFGAVDKIRQSKVEPLNKKGKRLLELSNEILGTPLVDVRKASFYSSFASMQQLLTALWCSESRDEFLDMIKNWIYGTDMSLNTYHSVLLDIASRNIPDSIRKNAIDMLVRTKREAIFVGWA